MKINKRAIWKKLKLALLAMAGIPAAFLIVNIIMAIIEGLNIPVSRWERSRHIWVLFVISFVLSLIYFFYKPMYDRDKKIKKYVSALILFWEAKLVSENKPEPPDDEIEYMRNALTKKVKRWISLEEERLSGNPGERSWGCPFDVVDLVLEEREKLAQLVGVLRAKS